MNIDLTPLYRHTVGYDRFASLLDAALRGETVGSTFPPYNIEVVDEDRYAITLAVAGFARNELEIELEKGNLSIRGRKNAEPATHKYLHQGIAFRSFERKFNLAEHVEVQGADYRDGLLVISLVRKVPEAMKPRRIEIGTDRSVLTQDTDQKPEKAVGRSEQAA